MAESTLSWIYTRRDEMKEYSIKRELTRLNKPSRLKTFFGIKQTVYTREDAIKACTAVSDDWIGSEFDIIQNYYSELETLALKLLSASQCVEGINLSIDDFNRIK